jgi:hypothetical protein
MSEVGVCMSVCVCNYSFVINAALTVDASEPKWTLSSELCVCVCV